MKNKKPEIVLIAAISEKNRVIGKGLNLPWHIPEDLKHFKQLTDGHTLLMGRKTFESLIHQQGAPLPNRRTVVLTSKGEIPGYPHIETYTSIKEALKALDDQERIFITGGAIVYKQFLPYVDRMELTMVEGDYEGDVYFPQYPHLVRAMFTVVAKKRKKVTVLKHTYDSQKLHGNNENITSHIHHVTLQHEVTMKAENDEGLRSFIRKHMENEEGFKIIETSLTNLIRKYLDPDISFHFVTYSEKNNYIRRRATHVDDYNYLVKVLEDELVIEERSLDPDSYLEEAIKREEIQDRENEQIHAQNEYSFKIIETSLINLIRKHLGPDINFYFVAYSKKSDFIRKYVRRADDYNYLVKVLKAELEIARGKANANITGPHRGEIWC